MVELMVVIAILGITAAVAISGFRANPTGSDARKVASMMATAYRTAVEGGAMTANISKACFSSTKPRAMLEFGTGGLNVVTVYKLIEHTADTGYDQVPVSAAALSTDVLVYAITNFAVSQEQPGATPTQTSLATPVTKYYCPDGSADGFTVYLRHATNDNATRYRVVGMPLSPAPQTFQDW
jgi:type II secretory pathway pseudopilin PulG